MRLRHLAVEAETGVAEGLPCSCCKKRIKDIVYYPSFVTEEESEWIKKIWNVDPYEEFVVCEPCMEGYCGAAPGSTPDKWLQRQIERYKHFSKTN